MTDDRRDEPDETIGRTDAADAADDGHRPATEDGGDGPRAGGAIVNASFAAIGIETLVGVLGVIDADAWGGVVTAVSCALFGVGVLAFLYGYAVGVVRSAEERVTLAGLFFLTGTAPKLVRFRLRVALAAQIVVAVAVGTVRAYTSVAFIVLVPMVGLGLMAAWGARHGTFFAKDEPLPERDGDG